jgi:hypothetical protein
MTLYSSIVDYSECCKLCSLCVCWHEGIISVAEKVNVILSEMWNSRSFLFHLLGFRFPPLLCHVLPGPMVMDRIISVGLTIHSSPKV